MLYSTFDKRENSIHGILHLTYLIDHFYVHAFSVIKMIGFFERNYI
jgi:hypothetical protein